LYSSRLENFVSRLLLVVSGRSNITLGRYLDLLAYILVVVYAYSSLGIGTREPK